jgi:hypothetical protein
MDDKDIRLRMLAGDKPRIEVSLQNERYRSGQQNLINRVGCKVTIKSIGLKTINRALIKYALISDGLSKDGAGLLESQNSRYITYFGEDDPDHRGLMPTDVWSTTAFSFPSSALDDCSAEPSVRADIEVLIDDGLPATMNFDVMAAIRPLIESGWRFTPS